MKKATLVISLFIILKFVLQFLLLNSEYELHRDEFLHLDQANHLAWGYSSVPPLTSWISVLIKALGNGIFWVKFFPALFGALTIVVVYKTVNLLNGNITAIIIACSGILFSILLRINTLYQPNSFEILCWTALCYTLTGYFKTSKPKYLYFSAIIFALGFLNKYNILFLLMALLPAVLITRQRTLFLKKELYFAIGLAILLISPNIYWQYTHNFPVIMHMQVLGKTQLVNVSIGSFLSEQLLYFTASLPILICGIVALGFYRPFRLYRPFCYTFFFVIALYILFKGKAYYAIGLYPIYLAFGATFITNKLKATKAKPALFILIILPLLFFIPLYFFAFPNFSPEYISAHKEVYKDLGALRWEDGKDHEIPMDYADMLGWQELARKTDSAYLSISHNKNATLIICDNYGQAGAINYYSKQNLMAYSFRADYRDWFDLDKKYTNLIRIKNGWEIEDEWKQTSPYFETAVITDSITNPYSRERGTAIFVFENANISINNAIKDELKHGNYFESD